jgi:hypothetical protein
VELGLVDLTQAEPNSSEQSRGARQTRSSFGGQLDGHGIAGECRPDEVLTCQGVLFLKSAGERAAAAPSFPA